MKQDFDTLATFFKFDDQTARELLAVAHLESGERDAVSFVESMEDAIRLLGEGGADAIAIPPGRGVDRLARDAKQLRSMANNLESMRTKRPRWLGRELFNDDPFSDRATPRQLRAEADALDRVRDGRAHHGRKTKWTKVREVLAQWTVERFRDYRNPVDIEHGTARLRAQAAEAVRLVFRAVGEPAPPSRWLGDIVRRTTDTHRSAVNASNR